MKKRIFALIMTLLMCASLLPVSVMAGERVAGGTEGRITWELDSAGVLTIGGTGPMRSYIQLSSGNTYYSSAPWGGYSAEISSVVIASGVTHIGGNAFFGCKNLTEAYISETVSGVSPNMFELCTSLLSIEVSPENAYFRSEDGVLFSRDMTQLLCVPAGRTGEYSIPKGVAVIAQNAFYASALEKITIPDGVSEINENAFAYCEDIVSMTVPDSVTTVGSGAFYECIRLKTIELSSNITAISPNTFYDCAKLNLVMIPDGVLSIGAGAFNGCVGLTSMLVPDSVKTVGGYAFANCTSLTAITIPDSVTELGVGVIENTAYYNNQYNWSDGLLYCAHHMMAAKTDITVSRMRYNTSTIAGGAFSGCTKLTTVSIPESVVCIGDSAFSGCNNLTGITIPKNVVRIGDYAFRDCTFLASFTIPDTVSDIGLSVLSGTAYYKNADNWTGALLCCGDHVVATNKNVSTVEIKNGIRTIADGAFSDCRNLAEISIPASVDVIGSAAFSGCTALKRLVLEDVGAWCRISFGDLNSNPLCSNAQTKTLAVKGETVRELVIPEGTESIPDHAFGNCGDITSVTLPVSLRSIGVSAFSGCGKLAAVNYAGLRDEWSSVTVGDGNSELSHAKLICAEPVHEHSYTAEITPPTCVKEGYTVYTCGCGDSYKGDIRAPLGHSYSAGRCTRCGMSDEGDFPTEDITLFDIADLIPSFQESIKWAVHMKITTGYSDRSFRPDAVCTRGHVVTFLWRAAGSPEPVTQLNAFTDVSIDSPFYKAILWAAEKGITTGYDDRSFRPNDPCTRAHVVTFLWRYEYKPQPDGAVELRDLGGLSTDFTLAIGWAASKGITTGYADHTFRPHAVCTRAHVVTFLYRDMTM